MAFFGLNDLETAVNLTQGTRTTIRHLLIMVPTYQKLFSTIDFSLNFNGQAAPMKKGRSHKIIQGAPESTMTYARAAIKK